MNPIDRFSMNIESLRLILGELEDAAWLQNALDAYVYEAKPLEESLGFKTMDTTRSPRWRIIDRQCAVLLRDALWECDGNTAELARKIERYEARLWPIYGSKQPPADWPSETRCIDAARRLRGKSLPSSGEGIRKLLARN